MNAMVGKLTIDDLAVHHVGLWVELILHPLQGVEVTVLPNVHVGTIARICGQLGLQLHVRLHQPAMGDVSISATADTCFGGSHTAQGLYEQAWGST